MSLLQYTSKEMFSSTELIRKSKTVFDKIHYEDIDKAVILRDGKPSFILMDFAKYEALINEYIELKNSVKKEKKRTEKKEANIEVAKRTKEVKIENISKNEIDQNDFQKALEEIDNLDLNDETKITKEENKKEALKDFWD